MRYTIILTVFLYVGLVLGFIAPSGAPKKRNDIVQSKRSEKSIVKINLSKGRVLDETSLHEHATEKEIYLVTRSSIYLKKAYKTPILHMYDYNKINPNSENYIIQSYGKKLAIPYYNDFPYRFSAILPQYFINQGIIRNPTPGTYKFVINKNNEVVVNSLQDKNNNKVLSKTNEQEIQQNYLELLKPPLIRNKNTENYKITYENRSENDLSKISTKPSKDYDKTENNPQMISQSYVDRKPTNNFRDIGPFYLLQNSAYGNHKFEHNPEYLDFHGEIAPINKHLDKEYGENLLHYNQKDTYRDIASVPKKYVNNGICNHLNCNISAENKHDETRHNCDCQNKRENLNKEGLIQNEAPFSSDFPKNNDYSETTDEESINKMANDDLIKSINKLNDTLEMCA